MSYLEAKIKALLVANAAVNAIVAGRVFPVELPKGTPLPAISLFRVSGAFDSDLDGYTGTENPRVQIDCWGKTLGQAKALGKAVRATMDAATEAAGGFTATVLSDTDGRDDAANSFSTSIDFSCWHTEE